MAAGYGTSPAFVFSGRTTRAATTSSSWSCCSAASRAGRSATGSTVTPGGRCSAPRPSEYTEAYYPVVHRALHPGAGLRRRRAAPRRHRGREGLPVHGSGEFTVHDDRALISPWGIGGGRAGGRSAKQLIRADGTVDRAAVEARRLSRGDGRAARVPHRRRGRLGRSARASRRRGAARRAARTGLARVGRVGLRGGDRRRRSSTRPRPRSFGPGSRTSGVNRRSLTSASCRKVSVSVPVERDSGE